MAQGWSSPSSSTESERSVTRVDFRAWARGPSARVPRQIRPALEQRPEHTEEFSVRYASTPALVMGMGGVLSLMLSWLTASPTHPQDRLPAAPQGRLVDACARLELNG